MQVTILAGMAGEPFAAGEVVDLPADRAKQLLSEGRAERMPAANDRPKVRHRPVKE